MDEFPDVAEYLRATLEETSSSVSSAPQQPPQHLQNTTSEEPSTYLMSQAQQIFIDETEGDVDERLRNVVSDLVLEGIFTGYQMTARDSDDDGEGGST